MMDAHTFVSEEANGSLATPTIPLSGEHLTQDGVFLLENGEDALIFVKSGVNLDILQQLFGITSEDIHITRNHNKKYLYADKKNTARRLEEFAKGVIAYGMQFFSYMVEDKTPNGVSYAEFLHHINKEIQVKLS